MRVCVCVCGKMSYFAKVKYIILWHVFVFIPPQLSFWLRAECIVCVFIYKFQRKYIAQWMHSARNRHLKNESAKQKQKLQQKKELSFQRSNVDFYSMFFFMCMIYVA